VTDVEIVPASQQDKHVLRNLMPLYLHDFSEFNDGDVDEQGRFEYPWLDAYWTDTDRHPFLFRAGDHWAGFALIRTGDPNDVAEFFVLRKYRRHGVGQAAARALFARFPGRWQVRQMAANARATAFWRAAIPVPFTESDLPMGPVQYFSIAAE
jgi:predicted acetyltransferase